MADQDRILAAALQLTPPFTVVDLAYASGVNLATVRTVLSRKQNWFQQIGLRDSDSRGGKYKTYEISPTEREALSRKFGARFHIGKYVEPPPSLISAFDILTRQLSAASLESNPREAPSELLDAAREDLQACTHLFVGKGHNALELALSSLQSLSGLWALQLEMGRSQTLIAATNDAIVVARQAMAALDGYSSAQSDAIDPDTTTYAPNDTAAQGLAIGVFQRLQEDLIRQHRPTMIDPIPAEALATAADQFKREISSPSRTGEDEFLEGASDQLVADIPGDRIFWMGADPAAYAAVVSGSKTLCAVTVQQHPRPSLYVNLLALSRVCRRLLEAGRRPATKLQTCLAAVGVAHVH